MMQTRTIYVTLALVGATLSTAAAPALAAPSAAPAATAPSCPTGWGSTAKSATAGTAPATPVRDIRTGRHDCYDRMVVDLPGAGGSGSAGAVGYTVRYVDRLYQDGSGTHIPVTGGAVLEVRMAAPSYDPETGEATYPARAGQPLPGVDTAGYRTFRDTRFAASFEGDTQIGLGVRARLPFRVLQLQDRLVVDVAHSWTSTR
ncbi:AMIN-like domain-containing (lipo)protein [Streptomyces prasinus]|uniref:AMIN-like domain-containing (lipo)protein n=1 Tax=Streptomyces prasinus TaxID=67345 RepID=UPI003B971ABE